MKKSKRETGSKLKAVREPRRKQQSDEKKPPFDLAKQLETPWFTLEGANGQNIFVRSQPKAFALELLGNIAARLLTGDDYIQAAQRACMLLLACEAFNSHVTNADKARTEHTARRNESDLPEEVEFNLAIRTITDQRRTDRAFPLFRKLLEQLFRYRDAAAQSEHIGEMKQRGFTKDYVLHLRDCFQFRMLTGQLGIRKPPEKKP